MPLLSFMWSDHILNDASWLRADTFSWHTGSSTTGVYRAAYAHLLADVDGKTLQSETVGSTTIQFYLADDGHKICPDTEESNVAAIYNATGVAWYYIIDTVNQRFKLPRTKYGFSGLRGNVGGYIAESLPNIKGKAGSNRIGIQDGSIVNEGAMYTESYGSARANDYSGASMLIGIDASRYSSTYKDGAPVQERSTEMYLYFYVGNFTQTALENTAGINTEMFNDLNAHKVIEFQEPTSANNYTWYRKYADGWIEQGGNYDAGSYSSNIYANITYPIEMANTRYTKLFGKEKDSDSGWDGYLNYTNPTTTGVTVRYWNNAGSTIRYISWQVSGMAA